MDWRQAEILDLICMYRENECLWNWLSSEYKDVNLKKNTWAEIADHFGRDVGEIKKKIKNLRTGYVSEKKRVDSSLNEAGEPTYEPRLFYYDEMTFLNRVIVLRTSNLDEQNDDSMRDNKAEPSSDGEDMDAEKSDPLREIRAKRSINRGYVVVEKKKRTGLVDEIYTTPQNSRSRHTERETEITNTPAAVEAAQTQIVKMNELCKEETFCAMLCSELKRIRSEDIYDNATAEIFAILKSAKKADRRNAYKQEDD
ncbi:uncharacterized protein LOC101461773 isoform X2 [Ceratitis capitata]|uniref:uncharacterized protein LOC101461773 isoform X2 n=1 Tax=Ceratitis capitata TaxID=7213 RepID=UPI0006189102|nr:uncharacterized protein LOC101461773 isoform X2 [Ceratitis capitata]